MFLGISAISIWIQEKKKSAAGAFAIGNPKRLSKVLVHEFCVIPHDLSVDHYCRSDGNDTTRSAMNMHASLPQTPFKLSRLQSVQIDSIEDFTNSTNACISSDVLHINSSLVLRRFKNYDTNFNDAIFPNQSSLNSLQLKNSVVNNSTMDMELVKTFGPGRK